MTLTDLLNMEVSDVLKLGRAGLDWWLRELAALLPAGWRGAMGGGPALVAEPRAGGGYRLTRHGQVAGQAPGQGGAPVPVSLVLPADDVLVCETAAPDLGDRDLRRMLRLDIDRLTPFAAEAVFADIAPAPRDPAGAGRRAVVAVVPRDRALAAVAAARAAGLDPRALVLQDPAGMARFDFAPAMREADALPSPAPYAAYAWGAVAALLALNLAIAVGRDMADVAHLRAAVDDQRPAVQQAAALRARAQREDARRHDLARRRAQGEPLRVIEAASRALPSSAWVQRLAWDGQAVRLAGFRQEAADVNAALSHEPLFAHVRNSMTDTPPRAAAGAPFDVTADVRPAP